METKASLESEFAPGTAVIYGLQGRCTVLGIETREIGGATTRFYKLEPQKSPLSRSAHSEPAVWVPVETANKKGLRTPLSNPQLAELDQVFSSPEYFFNLQEVWRVVLPKLETSIRIEGVLGLAKVLSYLHIMKRNQVVLAPEINRFFEMVQKLLYREISDLTEETYREIDVRLNRLMRAKLLANH